MPDERRARRLATFSNHELVLLPRRPPFTTKPRKLRKNKHQRFKQFLELPVELRLQIYREAFRVEHRNTWLPLLLVSQQIHGETLSILKEATLTIRVNQAAFEDSMNKAVTHSRKAVVKQYQQHLAKMWRKLSTFGSVELYIYHSQNRWHPLNRCVLLPVDVASIMPLSLMNANRHGLRIGTAKTVIEFLANRPLQDESIISRLNKVGRTSIAIETKFECRQLNSLMPWTTGTSIATLSKFVRSRCVGSWQGVLQLHILLRIWDENGMSKNEAKDVQPTTRPTLRQRSKSI